MGNLAVPILGCISGCPDVFPHFNPLTLSLPVGLRWGLLRRVRYGAVDTWSSDEEGFPLKLR